MLTISEHELKSDALARGYRPEILEKVYHLLHLLSAVMAVPYLKERLVLKGGTAINLFCTETLPRLSVDLDFNYIGSTDREIMRQEKVELERMILSLCQRYRYQLHRYPRAHAGGKMVLLYPSAAGQKGRLELDFNYLFRVPLWQPQSQSSADWPKKTTTPVLDIHELAAGKLHALLGREASRDLFDSHQLLTKWPIDHQKLRLAFVVYAGMEQRHWQDITPDNISFDVKEVRNQLIPVLQKNTITSFSTPDIKKWATHLTDEIKAQFSLHLLPFNQQEIDFLDNLQTRQIITPELISDDPLFCERVKQHPLLKWRTQQNCDT